MAQIYGDIKGVNFLRENPAGGTGGIALVSFSIPAYATSTDTVQLGGAGTSLFGAATTLTLAQILESIRRDEKLCTVGNGGAGSVGFCAETGKQGATEFYLNTFAVSAGNVTCKVANSAGTGVDAASGVAERPFTAAIAYSAA